jgi:hypothetical protein
MDTLEAPDRCLLTRIQRALCALPLASLLAAHTASEPQATHPPYPIVDAREAILFGAVDDSRWLDAPSAAAAVQDGMTYELYTLTRRIGERRGGKAGPPRETCSNATVTIADVPRGEQDVIAVGGGWNAMPRVPRAQSRQQPVYLDFVAQWLRGRAMTDTRANITQLIRVDLDGDRAEEVLISANVLRGAGTSARAGDYGVVLLRRIAAGDVQIIPLAEEYYPTGCTADCAPARHHVAALLDVNGDGVMEVVLAWENYEGRGKTIYRWDGEKMVKALSWTCTA